MSPEPSEEDAFIARLESIMESLEALADALVGKRSQPPPSLQLVEAETGPESEE
jgi:hypothetical protein